MYRLLLLPLTLISVWSFQNAAQDRSSHVDHFVRSACTSLSPVRFDNSTGRIAAATKIQTDEGLFIHLTILEVDGSVREWKLNPFPFKAIALVKDSVWFLSEDRLKEFNLTQNSLVGEYSTYPHDFKLELTTRPRDFTYDQGYFYIAHGELGVSIFDVERKTPYSVIPQSLNHLSLAASVHIQDKRLYVLNGAYAPEGFNGVSQIDLSNGFTRSIAYPKASGVVDPYSSHLQVVNENVLISNSGWIHGYNKNQFKGSFSEVNPTWIPLSEKVHTSGGIYNQYLTVNGNFLIDQSNLFACSSLHYIPVGQTRPITEMRLIKLELK